MTKSGARVGRRGEPEQALRSLLRLALLAAVLVGVGVGVWRVAGGPPITQPVWGELLGSGDGQRDAENVLRWLFWGVHGYVALVTMLRLVLTSLLVLVGGARWLRAGLGVSNLVTLPCVRKVVDGGVAGVLMVGGWSLDPPSGGGLLIAGHVAEVERAIAPAGAAERQRAALPRAGGSEERSERVVEGYARYTVARGETLWSIGERVAGDGHFYRAIWEANHDRVMAGGERFSDPTLIREGWVLRIPLPAEHLALGAEGRLRYRVQEGDHFWRIAQQWLGDGFRWTEVWDENRGAATSPGALRAGAWLELASAAVESRGSEEPEPPRVELAQEWSAPGGAPASAAETSPSNGQGAGRAAAAATPSPVPAAPGRGELRQVAAAPAVAAAPVEAARALGRVPAAAPDVAPAARADGSGSGLTWPQVEFPANAPLARAAYWGVAGAVVASGVLLMVHRRGGLRRRRSGDVARVTLATRALTRALADYGFERVRPLLVREDVDELRFTVAGPGAELEALAEGRHGLARRLDCRVDWGPLGAGYGEVRLRRWNDLEALFAQQRGLPWPALVVPLGIARGGREEVVYLNVGAVASLRLVATARDRGQLLRMWLRCLYTMHAPEELALSLDAPMVDELGPDAAALHGGEVPGTAEELLSVLGHEAARGRDEEAGRHRARLAICATADVADGALLAGAPGRGLALIAAGPAGEGGGGQAAVQRFGAVVECEELTRAGGSLRLRLPGLTDLEVDAVRVIREGDPRVTTPAPDPDRPPRWGRAEEDSEASLPEELERAMQRTAAGARPGEPAPPAAAAVDVAEEDAAGVTAGSAAAGAPWEERPPEEAAAAPVPAAEEERAEVAGAGAPGEEPTPGEAAEEPAPPAEEEGLPVVPVAEAGGASARAGRVLSDPVPEGPAAIAAAAPFEVHCFGSFTLRAEGVPVERWESQRARELLALLVVHGGSMSRQEICEALWPDEVATPTRVRKVVYHLRRALRESAALEEDVDPLLVAQKRVGLRAELFMDDVSAFEETLAAAAEDSGWSALYGYRQAFRMHGGGFLYGAPWPWAQELRRGYESRVAEAVYAAARLAEDLDSIDEAGRYYEILRSRRPSDEVAVQGVLRCARALGRPEQGREAYQTLVALLRQHDASVRPSQETEALYAALEEDG